MWDIDSFAHDSVFVSKKSTFIIIFDAMDKNAQNNINMWLQKLAAFVPTSSVSNKPKPPNTTRSSVGIPPGRVSGKGFTHLSFHREDDHFHLLVLAAFLWVQVPIPSLLFPILIFVPFRLFSLVYLIPATSRQTIK